jgi:phosphoesterase RecJ-like protein
VGGTGIADRKRLGMAISPAPGLDALLDRVVEVLRRGNRFLVTTHTNPDGDGIGSAAGLALALGQLGKEVVLYSADTVPESYRFLAAAPLFVRELAPDSRFDATIVTDCADLGRLGPHVPPPEQRGILVFLDHHLTRRDAADIDFNDDTAPAVGEIVLRIVRALGVTLTLPIAESLYVSLLSDTGSFRYANTTPAAMRCASELLAAGVDPWKVASHLYESQPASRLRLLGRVLATLEIGAEGRCASLRATQAMLAETGATAEMADGFVNYARSVAGVEVAVLFLEIPGGAHRVSFRSRGSVNVAAIAERLGGGGHFHAAGCTLSGEYPEVRARVAAAVREALS